MTSPEFGGYGGGGAFPGGDATKPRGPQPPAHLRITFSGVLGSTAAPVEIFAFGLAAAHGANASIGSNEALVQARLTAAAIAGRWTLLSPGIASSARLRRVRVASVNSAGYVDRTPQGAYIQGDHLLDAPGAVSAVTPPFQIALAMTLETQRAGANGRGRFFLPVPHTDVETNTGLMPVTSRDAHVTRARDFLNAVNADLAAGGWGRLVVASSGSVKKGIAPVLTPVTRVTCGRVLDTMRSRRGDLNDLRTGFALT